MPLLYITLEKVIEYAEDSTWGETRTRSTKLFPNNAQAIRHVMTTSGLFTPIGRIDTFDRFLMSTIHPNMTAYDSFVNDMLKAEKRYLKMPQTSSFMRSLPKTPPEGFENADIMVMLSC